MKRSLSIAVTTVAAAGLVALGATGAAAHVTVDSNTTEAGSYAVLTFSVPHGCSGSSTTEVAIQVPEAFNSVTPTVNPGWDVENVMESLDTPVDDGHGGQLTERVGEVVYTAHTPLPDGHRDAFELSVQLPDTPGETLAFPVVQTCEEGEAPWVQVASDGQDADELEEPAPTITLTEPGAAGSGAESEESDASAAADATEDAAPAEDTAADNAEDTADTSGDDAAGSGGDTAAADDGGVPAAVSWGALALGAGGLVLGALALARTRAS